MTIEEKLSNYLSPLGLGAWEFHPVIGSTNDRALAWARAGAPDWSLVLADAQTAGRGRYTRRWVTNPRVALAMSLVLRPSISEGAHISRFTALAALGLVRALAGLGLTAEIKWPNDVLLQRKKVAGVLVEGDWQADFMEALVVGMGVNITSAAVPSAETLRYPATSVVDAAGEHVDRWALLADILGAMMEIRSLLADNAFVTEWNAHLAFRNETVLFRIPGEDGQRVKILGVGQDGRLSVQREDGQMIKVVSGEIVTAFD